MQDILTDNEKQAMNKLLKQNRQIIAGYIFGSRTKINYLPNSDLDIALVCFNKQNLSPVDLSFSIDKLLIRYKTDVRIVDLNDDPLFLIQLLNGLVIFQKNLSDRIRLETRILHIYEDFQNLMNIRKIYLNKSFRKGVYADRPGNHL